MNKSSGKLGTSKLKERLEQTDLSRAMNQAIASTRSPVKASSNPTGEFATTRWYDPEACDCVIVVLIGWRSGTL